VIVPFDPDEVKWVGADKTGAQRMRCPLRPFDPDALRKLAKIHH